MTPLAAVKSAALELRALHAIDAIYLTDALAVGSARSAVSWAAKGLVGHDRRLVQWQDLESLDTAAAPEVPRG